METLDSLVRKYLNRTSWLMQLTADSDVAIVSHDMSSLTQLIVRKGTIIRVCEYSIYVRVWQSPRMPELCREYEMRRTNGAWVLDNTHRIEMLDSFGEVLMSNYDPIRQELKWVLDWRTYEGVSEVIPHGTWDPWASVTETLLEKLVINSEGNE